MSKSKHIPGQNMPKLGCMDQIIYGVLIIPPLAFSLSCLFIVEWVQKNVAFSDNRVIAATVGEGNLNCFFLMFWSMAAFVILLAGFQQPRIPIFGRKDVTYGPPRFAPIYPLLRKDHRKPKLTPRQKKQRSLWILLLLLSFLFSAAMFPRSFYGRAVMLEDGTVSVYDASNTLVQQYDPEDVCEVQLHPYSSGKYGGNWKVEMVVYTHDQERFRFAAHCFAGDEIQQLQTMLNMKTQYGSMVIISGTEDLHKVIQDQYSDPAEQEMLLKLFR